MSRWLRSVGRGRPPGGMLAANYLYLRKVVGWLGTMLLLIVLAATPDVASPASATCETVARL